MEATTERRTARGHLHVEAFCLMWYACPCGHQERYWNSRDGVTPFGSRCPSCGDSTLQHVRWKEDAYAPHHEPAHGQRLWVDMTRERAEVDARGRIESAAKQGHTYPPERFESLVLNIMGEHGGAAPDCVIFGVDAP